MNIYEELERISKQEGKEPLVKRYLLDCCEKYIDFRSSGELEKNLEVARKYLKGHATQKQIHRAEWELEGEAFGVSYYLDDESQFFYKCDHEIKSDLVKVRIKFGLSNKESRCFLEKMAYFIDSVFVYVEYSPNGIPRKEFEQFMCSKLFIRYFGGVNA